LIQIFQLRYLRGLVSFPRIMGGGTGLSAAEVSNDGQLLIQGHADGRVAPRSGLAAKHGIDTMAGVIDADYRGQVGVILANLSETDFEIKVGDRIAQLIVEKVCWT
jgi:dUTP pyrophosphatase